MNRLIEHIERLLLLHDCVIIPDFGGFVLRSVSASYNAETSMFFPPRKEVVFNRTLDHNDGLLMEAYMRAYETDFSKARQLVGNDVTLLKNTLEEEGELPFGTMGLFVKDEERLVFMAGKSSDVYFCTSSFGLPAFHFLPLQNRKQTSHAEPEITQIITVQPVEEENKMQEDKTPLFRIPVTKTFVRIVAAAAAAILLFLLISTPVKDVNRDYYQASFIPQEIMPKKIAENTDNQEIINTDNQKVAITDNSEVKNTPKKTDEKKVENASPETAAKTKTNVAITENKNTATKKTPVAETKTETGAAQKNFYVIIGSFDTRGKAEKYIKSLNGQEAGTAGIIVSDGRVRVYAQGFATEKSANEYMNDLRKTTKHKQAWTYRAKK